MAGKKNPRKTMVRVGDGAPGPGRPQGVKNKLTKEGLLAAREAFEPISKAALDLMQNHLSFHLAAQKLIVEVLSNGRIEDVAILLQLDEAMMHGNCATCRHIFTLSSEYRFGKPTQRVEFDVDDFVAKLRDLRPELDDDAAKVIAIRAGVIVERSA